MDCYPGSTQVALIGMEQTDIIKLSRTVAAQCKQDCWKIL